MGAAVIAAVMAEADPQYFYGGFPYAAYGAYPYAFAYSSACKNNFGIPVPCAAHTVAKRDAEAEADPQFLYGGYYNGYYPYASAYAAYPYAAYTAYTGCHNAAGAAVPCAYHNLAQYGFPRTYFGNGLVHTSRFGVCTNYLGQQ